jgi:hypothetical protein
MRIWTYLSIAAPLVTLAAQQKVDIRRAATPTISVRVAGALSSIHIIGWNHDSVTLTGTLGAGSRIDGGTIASAAGGGGPASGMKYYVDATDDQTGSNRLELHVPTRARVWIKAGSAEIIASDVTGGLDLNIVGGSVLVTGHPRELIVESMDGSVTVRGDADYARVKTATGDILMQGNADDVTLTTVSGSIRASDGSVQRGRYESVTGPVFFMADPAPGGDVHFDTHSGSIELRLARSTRMDLDASSVTGSIENGWSSVRPVPGHEGRGMELGLSSGMGGARVSVRSFKGNVKLVTRD